MFYSNESRQYELVAVTSYRNACTTQGLFTRIEPFADWILHILDDPPQTPTPRTTTRRSSTVTTTTCE
jgi:hypothetical protein